MVRVPQPAERGAASGTALLLATLLAALDAPSVAGAGPDVIACYDAGRQLVTHVLPELCQGERITPEREALLIAERRHRIEATVRARTSADPVTGTRTLIGTGSGFFISREGHLLTNNHVVKSCEMLTATPDDGAKIAARLVARLTQPDLALLATDRPPPAVARFSAAPERSDGNHLAVVGYPAYGLPTRLSTLSSARTEPLMLATATSGIRFIGEIRRGNSGSPLLDQAGNVLGVVYATIDTAKTYAKRHELITDVSFAVSYHAVLAFLASNAVEPVMAEEPAAPLAAEALHAKSRGFVVQIGCWK